MTAVQGQPAGASTMTAVQGQPAGGEKCLNNLMLPLQHIHLKILILKPHTV
ncbi:hypothetical protein TELCIR_04279 [Teladorsagia circumcincta]|uniref:Uncharacterized protein n=1 Tax=Teladorsagia circumcincta TaxID=45464 RepID=A0A2G9UU28_TELCI|nr:hypothetical protein TELCIR_04279 [Teladorsagia circumcincta]